VLMSMFTVYVDDSGTHESAKIAAAACCVSSVRLWKRYERDWIDVERDEGFKHFHMSAFAACHPDRWCRDCRNGKTDAGDHPWREWSLRKRHRVLKRLLPIVCQCVRFGAGWAIIKEDYNSVISGKLRAVTGEPFSYAFQCTGGQLRKWRAFYGVNEPMKYVFDLMPHQEKRDEIASLFVQASKREDIVQQYGMTHESLSFEDKKIVRQLLSADTLAWATVQELLHETGIRSIRQSSDAEIVCRTFEKNRPKITMGYQTQAQLAEWAEKETRARVAAGLF
jgi:hypothetical protein